MVQEYLIDTNVISHLFSNRIPEAGKIFVEQIINTSFLISVVVEIEVLTYHEIPEKCHSLRVLLILQLYCN